MSTAAIETTLSFPLPLSRHARQRMDSRRISPTVVDLVLTWGRSNFCRGAEIVAIGHREVELARRLGIDISGVEGVQLVVGHDGTVITAYRNRASAGRRERVRRRPRGGRR